MQHYCSNNGKMRRSMRNISFQALLLILMAASLLSFLSSACLHLCPAFNSCCKESGFLMVLKCREQNAALKECLTVQWVFPLFPPRALSPSLWATMSSNQSCCTRLNSWLRPTVVHSYKDPAFFEECKQEYIKEKLEFERTGIPTKNRKQKLPTSM